MKATVLLNLILKTAITGLMGILSSVVLGMSLFFIGIM